jgi:hypothetical protein
MIKKRRVRPGVKDPGDEGWRGAVRLIAVAGR